MRFLWTFTLFWCAISATMVGVAWQSSAPRSTIGFMSLFALIGLGLLAFLIKSHYERWRVGHTTLVARPVTLFGGDTLTLEFQVDNDNFAGQPVKFELLGQLDDDGWTTQQTIAHTASVQPALRQATGRLTLPDSAKASSAMWRWRASAALEKYPRVKVELDVSVSAGPLADAPSVDSFVLYHSSAHLSPQGAIESSPGVWTWHTRSRVIRAIGLVVLAFAGFWLWNTAEFALPPRGSDDGTPAQLMGLAIALFGLPFWLGGIALCVIGLVMLTFSQSATARRDEIQINSLVLSKQVSSNILRAADISSLQATASMSSGPKVMRYGLAARTDSGAVNLPFSAKTIQDLAMQARWLCDVLGISNVPFDPQLMTADARKRAHPKNDLTRNRMGRWVGRLMGVSAALAVAAFVAIFVSVATGRMR